MSRWPRAKVPAGYAALLRCASLLVPRRLRSEWSAEWRSELWYVRRRCDGFDADHGAASGCEMAFCLGAFQDALWLRKNSPGSETSVLGAAQRCGWCLVVLAVACVILALLVPGAREAMTRRPVPSVAGLVQISRDATGNETGGTAQTIPVGYYRAWKHRRQRLFADFAFYRPLRDRVPVGDGAGLSVVLASDNLFRMLNIPVASSVLDEARLRHRPALVVSEAAWRRYFGEDPALAGKMMDVAGQQVVVAAVLPDSEWGLTNRTDAWLLEDESSLAALPESSPGFIVGRILPERLVAETSGRWTMFVAKDGVPESFACAPLSHRPGAPSVSFLFTLLLACLALPATTPLPLGDYPAPDATHADGTRWRRWIFLLTKVGLAVLIVYCGSMSLAFLNPAMSPEHSLYVQFSVAFAGLLFWFRWALRDQRRRCPVCLQMLTHPARVGEASRNFLGWHGTEFICGEGHGLLHVPEVSTTWFSTQRWLYLDASWKGLFVDPCLHTTVT
jgi:MacB-like periplasmic core domain